MISDEVQISGIDGLWEAISSLTSCTPSRDICPLAKLLMELELGKLQDIPLFDKVSVDV
uniref:Uncharacterized protein n=1 Tax=Rhizophora mucronata TaxID=61149 RepID=A0A2P2MZR8_RHIMU